MQCCKHISFDTDIFRKERTKMTTKKKLFFADATSLYEISLHSFPSYADTQLTCHSHLHSLHPPPDQTQLCVRPKHLSKDSWSQLQHDRHNPPWCPSNTPHRLKVAESSSQAMQHVLSIE